MTARRVSAVLGAALAAAAVVFTSSLVATNDRQAVSVAERLLAAIPVKAGARTVSLAADYRPEGRVMQGPPLMAVVAEDDGVEGAKVAKSFFAARRLDPPPVGETFVLVGRRGAYKVKITGYIDWDRPARGYPNMLVSPSVAAGIGEEWRPFKSMDAKTLSRAFMSDAARSFDMSKTLLLWAAFLTALALVVNSLFLSIEAKRREIALLRVAGMTRGAVAGKVFLEAAAIAFLGGVVGAALGVAALFAYVACDKTMFPEGAAVSYPAVASAVLSAIPVAAIAGAIALKKALSVRPLEAASAREPRSGHVGMIVAFAFGFGAFVAVEVWGASLMRSFVPSKAWPDAIVSILPGGVSSFDIEKLKKVEGVKRISELQPLQVNISPLEELKDRRGGTGPGERRMKQYRNALLLASEWMPDFDGPGSGAKLSEALREDDTCVITKMMARARGLQKGDFLNLDCGRGLLMKLKVAGIIDLNWHMVTSRGLLRGLARMPVNTDGPVFTSFDTLAGADARPQEFVTMTHLWLDFEPDFLAANGVFGAGRKVERGITEALGGAWLKTKAGDVRGNTVRLHSRDEIADGTLAHGSNLIGSMARVPFIFIVVISLGFIAMVAASADARKKEFAALRAVGATRWQIARILAGEAVCVALKGMLFGAIAGSLAGWLFTFATRSAMSNWGIPPAFAVPWATILAGAAVSVACALAIAVPVAGRCVSDAARLGLGRKSSVVKALCAIVVAAGAFAAPAHPVKGRPPADMSQTTANWKPDRSRPVKTGQFQVDMIVVAFPDCHEPPADLDVVRKALTSIGRENFANAENSPDGGEKAPGEYTVADYYKIYSQGVTWPVFAIYPVYYMAPQPIGYYCRWNAWSNPIGYKDDGAARVKKLREDALRHVKSRGKRISGGSFNCWVYCRKVKWSGPDSGAEKCMRPYYRKPTPKEIEDGAEDRIFDYSPQINWGDPLWQNSTIQLWYPGSGGVMVHELGHCLGAPDFYHATEECDGVPGAPSLKWAYGPTGPAYCRWKYQAFVPPNAYPVLKTSGTYKLGPRSGAFPMSASGVKADDSPGPASQKAGLRALGFYVPTTHPNYMLYLEYCHDEKPPVGDPDAEGLLVSVINVTMRSPYHGPPDLCYTYRRDDGESCKGFGGSPYLGEGDSFTTNSNPAAFLPNRLPAGVGITNIRMTPDGSCVFDLEIAPPKLTKRELDFSLLPQTRLVSLSAPAPTSVRAQLDVLYRGEPLKSEYGFCYGTKKDPDAAKGTGKLFALHHRDRYDARIIDLEPGATYFFRAYARNEKGMRYSENQKKITLPAGRDFAERATPPLFAASDHLLDTWYVKRHHFGRSRGTIRNANNILAFLALANYYREIPGEEPRRFSRAQPVGKRQEGAISMEYVHSNPSDSRPKHRMKDVNALIGRMTSLVKGANLLNRLDFELDDDDDDDSAARNGSKRKKKKKKPSVKPNARFGGYSEWIANCAANLKIKKPEEAFFPCGKPEELEKLFPRIKGWMLLSQPVMLVRENTTKDGETEFRWPLDIVFIDGIDGERLHAVFPLGCDRGDKSRPSGSWLSSKELLEHVTGAVLVFYRPGPVPQIRFSTKRNLGID